MVQEAEQFASEDEAQRKKIEALYFVMVATNLEPSRLSDAKWKGVYLSSYHVVETTLKGKYVLLFIFFKYLCQHRLHAEHQKTIH